MILVKDYYRQRQLHGCSKLTFQNSHHSYSIHEGFIYFKGNYNSSVNGSSCDVASLDLHQLVWVLFCQDALLSKSSIIQIIY